MRAKKIMCVVGYDISDNRKRNKVEKLLSGHGVRVNKSLFECMLSQSYYDRIVNKLHTMIDSNSDKVVIYRICINCYTSSLQIPMKNISYDAVKIL